MKLYCKNLLRCIFILMPVIDMLVILFAITAVGIIAEICLILFVAAFAGCGTVLLWDGIQAFLQWNIGIGLGYTGLGLFGILLGELSMYLGYRVICALKRMFRFGKAFLTSKKSESHVSNKASLRTQWILHITKLVLLIAVLCILAGVICGNGTEMLQYIIEHFNSEQMAAFWGISAR